MIRDLSITNLGVIAETRLEFAPGLTVLSGETGAGKTLVTTALALLLGGKSDAVLVRAGAAEAMIDCTFLTSGDLALAARLDELGAAVEEGEFLVTRSIGARSRSSIGGRPVAASVLATLLGERVTLHGQHGQARLMRASDQRALLDASATDTSELLPVVRQAWQNLTAAEAALDVARRASAQDERAIAAHREFLDDVNVVSPRPGEQASLDARIAALSTLDEIARATRTASAMLIDGDALGITDASMLLAQARRLLEPHASSAPFADWIDRITQAQEAISSAAHEITAFIDDLDADDTSLDALHARRSQIGALLRRWNSDLETLLARADSAAQALNLAADPQLRLSELHTLAEHCRSEMAAACSQLHAARDRAGAALAQRVETELHTLGLPHARFAVHVSRLPVAGAHGDDAVEFLFTANPGQPLQPLVSVGSGGELSRVMLALETVGGMEHFRTFVFDEVDAGVGGRAALEVGRRLADLAATNQVIVVTHLAQVAAFADQHIVIEKTVHAAETRTTARTLATSERPRELTRLLSGVEDSVSARAHAVELLELAAATRAGLV